MRPDGFYWVKWDYSKAQNGSGIKDWEVAQLSEGEWYLMGGDNLIGNPVLIGAHIEPPTESRNQQTGAGTWGG